MPAVSEDQLASWTKPASDSEDAKRERTEKLIREAISAHTFLRTIAGDISVYAKGSYRNNTNVRRDSDVDIAVEYIGAVYTDYGDDTNQDEVRRVRGTSAYSGPLKSAVGGVDAPRYKSAIQEAMVGAFGAGAVTRSNKVITVRESSRSLAADLVPCQTYRKYWSPHSFREGIRLLPDQSPGHPIKNFPQQHYDNGVEKNANTSMRFKSVVRILKNLENKMVADGNSPQLASYLIECLVFNAPNSAFAAGTWAERVRNVLVHIWDDLDRAGVEERWMEVNDIKYLFHGFQKWKVEDARAFSKAAWQYVSNS